MSDVKVTKKKRAKKTPKQLDYEIELYRHVRTGDRHPRLAILDDDGGVQGIPSKDQIKEFFDVGSINGRHDLVIGIRYEDRRKHNVAISLTRKEAQAFLRFL
jgi:hypothetical protein